MANTYEVIYGVDLVGYVGHVTASLTKQLLQAPGDHSILIYTPHGVSIFATSGNFVGGYIHLYLHLNALYISICTAKFRRPNSSVLSMRPHGYNSTLLQITASKVV